jgi:hypothetical protein
MLVPDKPLKLHELRRLLAAYGVAENPSKGKGSHTTFFLGTSSYPVPTNRSDVARQYVSGCRRRFSLTPADGVSDYDFYEGKGRRRDPLDDESADESE